MPDRLNMVGTTPTVITAQDKSPGVASLWNDVVASLEQSADADLSSGDAERSLHGIKSVRQFIVASTTNKSVVGNSKVLRPRLTELLSRLQWWSTRRIDFCSELCGLLNSLVRDCSDFTTHLLQNPELPAQLISVILSPESDVSLRQTCLLLLRSLFGAEEMSSVLSRNDRRYLAATHIFTESVLRGLLQLRYLPDATQRQPALTNSALCYLMQMLALLATEPCLATSLYQLSAIPLCHEIIQSTRKDSVNLFSVHGRLSGPQTDNRTSMLTVRFAMKLLVHLFFHVNSSLEAFKKVYGEKDPRRLLACYSHLLGSTQSLPSAVNRKSTNRLSDNCNTICDIHSPYPYPNNHQSSLFHPPSVHGTHIFLGLLRGLIYWRMLNRSTVDALDQFGTRVKSSTGLRLSDDDVALLVIQPLTEGCLYVEDIRILSWICHVLVLVLNRRSELHFWAVYTNSFIREVNSRVTSVISAVQEASDQQNHIQFLEHLIPLVKLFACLASMSEAIRVLFTESSMCNKLVDFTLHLKPLGPQYSNLVLEYQYSICAFLQVLSRSFSAHHSYFRHEKTVEFLLNCVQNNLRAARHGHTLCASLVETASSTLVNILLPLSPARALPDALIDRCINVFINLIKSANRPPRSTSSPSTDPTTASSSTEVTADLRPCHTASPDQLCQTLTGFRLNGIWGLAHLLHGASFEFCSQLFERLIEGGAWLDLVRPVLFTVQSTSLDSLASLRRVSLESGSSTVKSFPMGGSQRTSTYTAGQPKQRSESLPSTMNPIASKQSVSVQALLVYYTLMFLRNLLRHRKLIDSVVDQHWWHIAQLIISVLEGEYPPAVKEQGILVLAHIANGRTALEELYRNGDLTEKIKLFMRSSDNYIKAAALTATYNLLGLGRELADHNYIMDSTKQSFSPFFQPYHRRFRHPHHRHKDRSKRKRDAFTDTSTRSPPSDPYRRDLISSVAQTALQEAEELEDEEQDIVVDHGNLLELNRPSSSSPGTLEATSSSDIIVPSSGLSGGSQADTLSPPYSVTTIPSTSNPRRHRRSYRLWQSSPESPSVVETNDFSAMQISSSNEETLTEHLVRSSSDSSTFSGTSSTSCAEEFGDTSTNIADLDRSTAQDLYALSPECGDVGDLLCQTPGISETLRDSDLMPNSPGSRAPLASEELMEDVEPQVSSGRQVGFATEEFDLAGYSEPVTTTEPTVDTATANSFRPTRPRRHWEVGFHHVLLPFLRELESNHILRSTWDWLMLRASVRGRPIQLHQLLIAWQRLYDTLPSTGTPATSAECTTLDSSLFTNCSTVNNFLQRLRESSLSPHIRSLRHCDSHRHHSRRRHHHCHRHHTQSQGGRRLTDRPVMTSTVSEAITTTTIEPEQTSEHLVREHSPDNT